MASRFLRVWGATLSLVLVSAWSGPATAAQDWTVFNPIEDATLGGACGNLCWAASAANGLAATGWGVPDATGQMTGQSVFNEMLPTILAKFGNNPGDFRNAAEIYFDLHRTDWGVPPGATWADWKPNMVVDPHSWTNAPPHIADLLNAGVAPILSVTLPGGGGHAINAWGYRTGGMAGIDQMVITDNEWTIAGPTRVDIGYTATSTTISNYERFGQTLNDVPIFAVGGVRSRAGYVDVMIGNDIELSNSNGPLALLGTDQPIISPFVASYLQSIYQNHPEATGITDAPLIGFNGVTLSAADTGWTFLRYTPGPLVADQIAGNGIDDLTAFSFSFPALQSVLSATLTLQLTPQSPGVTTDQLFFTKRPYSPLYNWGNALLRGLPVGEPATVTFDLAAMPFGPNDSLANLLPWLSQGDLGVIYGDDAIIQSATLEVRGILTADVQEPPAVLLMLSALSALAMLAVWRKRGVTTRFVQNRALS